MKAKLIQAAGLALALILSPVLATVSTVALVPVLTGCATTSTFTTLKDTWTISYAAYRAYCDRVAQGKVTVEQQATADQAWNTFRATFRSAVMAAKNNQNAPVPPEVKAMAEQTTATLKAN